MTWEVQPSAPSSPRRLSERSNKADRRSIQTHCWGLSLMVHGRRFLPLFQGGFAGGNVESDHEICEMSLQAVLTTLSLIVSS